MTDWKAKFDSVVKDTNNSLQNVKMRLEAARSNSRSALMNRTIDFSSTDNQFHEAEASLSHHTNYFIDNNKSEFKSKVEKETYEEHVSTNIQLPDHMLHDKINRQHTMIEYLSDSINAVNKEHDLLRQQVSNLQDELSFLKRQQAVKALAPAAEKNAEIWRKNVEMDLKNMELQIQSKQTQNGEVLLLTTQFTTLQSSFTELRRTLLTSLSSIQSEMNNFKYRLDDLEEKVLLLSTENRHSEKVLLGKTPSVKAIEFKTAMSTDEYLRNSRLKLQSLQDFRSRHQAKDKFHTLNEIELSDDDLSGLDSISMDELV